MNQKKLFDDEPLPARRSDPETSKIAARTLIQTGSRDTQQAACLAALAAEDGLTSGEVGKVLGAGYNARYVAARRLPELERAGVVRKGQKRACTTNGNQMVTWWVK